MKLKPVYQYQEYLLQRIDILCWRNTEKVNQTNRILLHCIADLEDLWQRN